jgi:hypothetical protein
VTDDRYARQRAVPAIGPRGQLALAKARVVVDGDQADAELAARYLAGAGVGQLCVADAWVRACCAVNGTIEVDGGAPTGALRVRVGDAAHTPTGSSAVERGARAARWALARALAP